MTEMLCALQMPNMMELSLSEYATEQTVVG